MKKITRRKALASVAAATGAAATLAGFGPKRLLGAKDPGLAYAAGGTDKRFLITVGLTGGASIIDSLLGVREEESANGALINAFPAGQINDVGPFSCVDLSAAGLNLIGTPANFNHGQFAQAHLADLMVTTVQNTSVNHVLAQKRAINGNAAWGGRTLQEMVALTYGADCPVPNANMASFGFLEPGADTSMPAYVYPESIGNPRFWSLGLDPIRGLRNAPDSQIIELAAKLRSERLDPESVFWKTFRKSKAIQKWMQQRGATRDQIRTLDLITKLTIIPDRSPEFPLAEYGLEQTPDGQKILEAFPLLEQDSLHAQAALGYLLIKYGVSVSVTLSPGFNPEFFDVPGGGTFLTTPPLAYDFSHGAHRITQNFMWGRAFDVCDKMITLLKQDEFEDTGESLYDRALFYGATDFGRTKLRAAPVNFGTGHDLNNGAFMVCAKGKAGLYGGVNPDTAMTYGFNLQTGAPDPGRSTTETEMFAGILQLLGIDTTSVGLPDVAAFRP